MTSIKIKFRPSVVDGKEGGLYFQIIHNRVVRQQNTDYKVRAEEWDAESESIFINGNCSNYFLGIQECLAWDVARLEKVVCSLVAATRISQSERRYQVFHKVLSRSVSVVKGILVVGWHLVYHLIVFILVSFAVTPSVIEVLNVSCIEQIKKCETTSHIFTCCIFLIVANSRNHCRKSRRWFYS